MSHASVQAVLQRTLSDESFRARLLSEPEQALRDYDLTPGESSALHALSAETLHARAIVGAASATAMPLWVTEEP